MASKKDLNVVEVDGKKKRDTDLGKEMEHATAEAEIAVAKVAEAEAKAADIMQKWQRGEEDRELKLKTDVASMAVHGMQIPDPTVIPEFLDDREGNRTRMRDNQAYVYRWVRAIGETPRVPWRRTQGYEALYYDDIKDTINDWQPYGAERHILLGDCIMMRIPRRKYDQLRANKIHLDNLWSRKTEEDFLEQAADLGVQVYREGASGRKEFA